MKVLLAGLALVITVAAAQASPPSHLSVSRAALEDTGTFEAERASFSELSTTDVWRDSDVRQSWQGEDGKGDRWDDSKVWGDDHHGDFGDGWHDHDHDHDHISAVPESATWIFLACGLGALALRRFRKFGRS